MFVRPSGVCARLLGGAVLVEPDWIEVKPGLYTPDELAT